MFWWLFLKYPNVYTEIFCWSWKKVKFSLNSSSLLWSCKIILIYCYILSCCKESRTTIACTQLLIATLALKHATTKYMKHLSRTPILKSYIDNFPSSTLIIKETREKHWATIPAKKIIVIVMVKITYLRTWTKYNAWTWYQQSVHCKKI